MVKTHHDGINCEQPYSVPICYGKKNLITRQKLGKVWLEYPLNATLIFYRHDIAPTCYLINTRRHHHKMFHYSTTFTQSSGITQERQRLRLGQYLKLGKKMKLSCRKRTTTNLKMRMTQARLHNTACIWQVCGNKRTCDLLNKYNIATFLFSVDQLL